jgi:hypothetical protein
VAETYKMVVMTNAVSGADEEFNTWYQQRHLPEVLTVPGITGAQRYRLMGGDGRWKFLAIYELDTADFEGVMATLKERAESGEMMLTDTMDNDTLYHGVFEPVQAK